MRFMGGGVEHEKEHLPIYLYDLPGLSPLEVWCVTLTF